MIVTLGKLVLQELDWTSPKFAVQLIQIIQKCMPRLMGQILNESLNEEVTRLLQRPPHKRRRRHSIPRPGLAECSKCHTRDGQKFRRDGHYSRNLVTNYGTVRLAVPQMECECGGKVRYKFKTIGKGQRFWVDVKALVRQEYANGQSYRQIKLRLEQQLKTSVGLRTLNRQVLEQGKADRYCKSWKEGEAPPVVRVDGIWLTIMSKTEEVRPDRCGRQRPVKLAKRIPILVAQGVWPESGKTEIIAWMLAKGEDEISWQTFLEMLYDNGLTPENGLKLLVSDGGTGFLAAYQRVYWMVPRQRCIFHKLKNLAQDLTFEPGIRREERKRITREFLVAASQIWKAPDKTEAQWRYEQFCSQWEQRQPKAVQTLQRDFEATLTFYDVMEQAQQEGKTWSPHLLRTTSPLERIFREFRRRFRQAVLFHSPAGAQAAVAQLVSRFS
jgi:transposase-like protein